jgi:hypothetical protein
MCEVLAATKLSALYASSIGSRAVWNRSIWNQWSITVNQEHPACSPTAAVSPRASAIVGAPPGSV